MMTDSSHPAAKLNFLIAAMLLLPCIAPAEPNTCFGTTAAGRLAGRTYVHSAVRDILIGLSVVLLAEVMGAA